MTKRRINNIYGSIILSPALNLLAYVLNLGSAQFMLLMYMDTIDQLRPWSQHLQNALQSLFCRPCLH